MDMVTGKTPIDWGCAEMLALGSLLIDGIDVRLAGQDAQRGTFSHRHSVWHDVKNGQPYVPLANLSGKQGTFTTLNTMLSELAVLGFEYGVSYANPHKLTIWEAQFGDFANGAQAIMDQFISSSEAKWQKMSGLVMLLPHGFEGQGPEHSSARLERYQALCAEDNMQVGCPTTPAQYFHLLRRQMLRSFRKPLVLMMPKSLLRHKDSTSAVDDLTKDVFQPVMDDPGNPDPKKVKRVLFCTGKVFFDLAAGRAEQDPDQVAIIRIEEHYPFPWSDVEAIVAKYGKTEVCWVQEEPQNMGSWDFMEPKLHKVLANKIPVRYIGRKPTAATATGIQNVHQAEQLEIVETSLDV
jgi:2-oxoglutarate dehydrogenase E1 component